jgi:hypothetical protein
MPCHPKLPKHVQRGKPGRTEKDTFPRYPSDLHDEPIDFYLRVRKGEELMGERPKSVNRSRSRRVKKDFIINSKQNLVNEDW